MFRRTRIICAVLYCLFVVFVFFGLNYADPGWAEGGIPLVVITLPWSVGALMVEAALSIIPFVDKALASDGANFFTFVIVCGGLNTTLILGPRKVLRFVRDTVGARVTALVAATILVAIVQVVGPLLDQDALERSRPQNVPKDATHVGGAIGLWQKCRYDAQQS